TARACVTPLSGPLSLLPIWSPRGHHGASRWIHWAWYHGSSHGQELAEGRLSTGCPQPEPGTGSGAGGGGSQGGVDAEGSSGPERRGDHDAAQLPGRGAGGARAGRAHRGNQARAAARGHVDDLAPGLPEGGEGAGDQGRPHGGRAGVGRGEGRHRRGALDHGRRREGRLRCRPAHLPGPRQDHHAPGAARGGGLHQARQPDHRGGESHRPRRGAHPGQEGGPRSRAHPEGPRGRARGIEVPRAEDPELHRGHLQPRLQDRPSLQGSGPDHGVLARPRRAAAVHRGGAGAVQRHAREGQGRARSLRRDHAPRGAGGRAGEIMRATVDRPGLDSQGRSPLIKIRRVRKGDLSKVRDVIEEGDGKIVGAALAVMWGTVGVIGPVAVLTNYQNQDIGQQLLAACQEFFDENKATLQGLATYPYSPKHLVLYQKFGYKPKGLVVVTSKAMDRAEAAAAAARPAPKPGLAVRRYSTLEEARKKQVMQKVRRITNGFWRGLDLAKE